MTTVVGIMDREGWDQRTDILVVVNPKTQDLLWVPRDLFCESVNHRINHAFQKGGHELLQSALLEHGIFVDHSVCVLRSAVENALLDYELEVPVDTHLEFYYPLSPQARIEDGQKIIEFEPPVEVLRGERFHQWMGARVPPAGSFDATSDLARLPRQQILLRRLLEEKFDFARIPHDGLRASSPLAFEDLAKIRCDWNFYTLEDVTPLTIRKMWVLVRKQSDRVSRTRGL